MNGSLKSFELFGRLSESDSCIKHQLMTFYCYLQFSHIIEKLAKDYSIVTFDAYGCGESPKPEKPKEAYSTEV